MYIHSLQTEYIHMRLQVMAICICIYVYVCCFFYISSRNNIVLLQNLHVALMMCIFNMSAIQYFRFFMTIRYIFIILQVLQFIWGFELPHRTRSPPAPSVEAREPILVIYSHEWLRGKVRYVLLILVTVYRVLRLRFSWRVFSKTKHEICLNAVVFSYQCYYAV